MGGGAVFGEVDACKHAQYIKFQGKRQWSSPAKLHWQLHRHQLRCISDMIRESVLFAAIREAAFKGQENIAALPAPVQTVDLRIQWMIWRITMRVRFVRDFIHPNVETEARVFTRWDARTLCRQPT